MNKEDALKFFEELEEDLGCKITLKWDEEERIETFDKIIDNNSIHKRANILTISKQDLKKEPMTIG